MRSNRARRDRSPEGMKGRRSRLVAVRAATGLAMVAVALVAAPVASQGQDNGDSARVHASRPQLEALAEAAERVAMSADADASLRAQKRAEAESIRARLRDGDFRPEDRIVLWVRGDSALTDTFTVRAGRTLDLPDMPPISLEGVLRAELQEHITRHITRFVKAEGIEARPLIRLAVIGEVTRPGFYLLTPNRLVSDAIMLAGGPTGEADLTRTTVRRDTSDLWKPEALRAAMREGRTLGQLDLGPGDEIIVGERKQRDWLRTVSVVSGILLSVYGATRLF